ncbi:phage tail protein, partial [Escherichia coli]|nr:phage tail protein [Escherichia coli]
MSTANTWSARQTFNAGITGTLTGNADTATKLKTARKIGGVTFDGSADINLPGVNIAGNQNTSGNAATATKLQTARTINGVKFDGSADITLTPANLDV